MDLVELSEETVSSFQVDQYSPEIQESHDLFYTIAIFFFSTLPSWFFSLTYSISAWILTILSWSFTLQLNFPTVVVLFLLLLTGIRLLTTYSRLPTVAPTNQGGGFDLHPDVVDGHEASIKNCPDKFLSMFLEGIKVFGYLEEPVFHELARHLQTKRLLAEDTLDLEKERSFYTVIDGRVQVFVKVGNEKIINADPFESDDMNGGYQLLNEVESGGTLSSLFTILSLFTDDVELRYSEDQQNSEKENKGKASETTSMSSSPNGSGQEAWSNVLTHLDNQIYPDENYRTGEKNNLFPSIGSSTTKPQKNTSFEKDKSLNKSVHPNIIARATDDATLVVIPVEAFHRLTEKFPNAVAHIVQVILTRFQRVTFWTGYKYLGLTKDLLRTEKAMNDIASYGLPANFFRPGSMERLRRKFVNEGKKNLKDDAVLSDRRFMKKVRPYSRPGQDLAYGSDIEFTPAPRIRPSFVDEPRIYLQENYLNAQNKTLKPAQIMPNKDFDAEDEMHLQESVYEGIAKGIGLLRPADKAKPGHSETGIRTHYYFDPISTAPYHLFSSSPYSSTTTLTDILDDDSVTDTTSGTSEFDSDVKILFYSKGSLLIKEGERDVGLFFVIDGLLDVSVSSVDKNFLGTDMPSTPTKKPKDNESKKPPNKRRDSLNNASKQTNDKSLFMIKPGGIAGYLAALTGFPSFVNIRASTDTCVGYLPKAALSRLMEKNPNILLTLAKRLIGLLSPLVLHIDFAMDWMQVNAGQVLFRKGDPSDSIYIVLNGRVRAINESVDGTIDIIAEYGQGQSIGELEVITNTPRPYTLHAIRDTELARMPRTLFNALALRHPEITLHISRLIASRTRLEQDREYNNRGNASSEFGKNNTNLKTVGILPINTGVPITQFADKLKNALEMAGETTILLNQASVTSALGKHAFSKMGRLKLISWLAEQEEKARIVLYLADGGVNSSWMQKCIRQADCILLVALGDGDPSIGKYERLLIGAKTTARKELVLLHSDRSCSPGTTRQWLKDRLWIHAHHHVQMPLEKPTILEQTPKSPLMNIRDHISNYYPRIPPQRSTTFSGNRSDFSRLARRLCGKSVGLVLGGGGARGCAHIGVLRALEEAGIPIDMVGGVSIGSYVGGLYARVPDHVAIIGRAKAFCGRMSSKWRQIFDLTYPLTAWFSGHEFNRTIWKSFFDTQIEDMWLSYFAVTTNLTWSRMEVHQSGSAWRYIRASMSLAAFLPPLCENGDLLLDGGYMDNLPVSVMKSMGAKTIFAVDVAAHDDTSPVYYGDSISGWWVLFNRWNPFRRGAKIPTMTDIQSRLTYVSSARTLELAKKTPNCFFMELPVQQYGTLEFNRFEEIVEVGYKAGKEMLNKWKKEGKLKDLFDKGDAETKRGRIRRRNSV
ncbi:1142_t:CDS:2 [Paraglomus brasilianum]|uniref:Lysophospholipase NTE1 n=1 Tax=Paraglomus brasilianum TaxID=144538 RepID=A0A9N9FX97_9GLOM|nr:1142_t:CDS:2 [Paraglomus brasilianum]